MKTENGELKDDASTGSATDSTGSATEKNWSVSVVEPNE